MQDSAVYATAASWHSEAAEQRKPGPSLKIFCRLLTPVLLCRRVVIYDRFANLAEVIDVGAVGFRGCLRGRAWVAAVRSLQTSSNISQLRGLYSPHPIAPGGAVNKTAMSK
ncbi:hypothetical protein NDU88_007492 [Pleurodeles waltl]|uniref:Uncharacterized protein n=1 Tax=Pleurodeles waltl TaxID=8319 RepID=A0AAV7N488_PLEWA|nr:hypothetical protein NDU88_007492 [Pleurodeles waltl]